MDELEPTTLQRLTGIYIYIFFNVVSFLSLLHANWYFFGFSPGIELLFRLFICRLKAQCVTFEGVELR